MNAGAQARGVDRVRYPELRERADRVTCSNTAALLGRGISAQLLVREADRAPHAWHGVRRVPLGLLMRRRSLVRSSSA